MVVVVESSKSHQKLTPRNKKAVVCNRRTKLAPKSEPNGFYFGGTSSSLVLPYNDRFRLCPSDMESRIGHTPGRVAACFSAGQATGHSEFEFSDFWGNESVDHTMTTQTAITRHTHQDVLHLHTVATDQSFVRSVYLETRNNAPPQNSPPFLAVSRELPPPFPSILVSSFGGEPLVPPLVIRRSNGDYGGG